MKEVRILMNDDVHAAVKKNAVDQDLKLSESIEQLLVLGLDHVKKGKK